MDLEGVEFFFGGRDVLTDVLEFRRELDKEFAEGLEGVLIRLKVGLGFPPNFSYVIR